MIYKMLPQVWESHAPFRFKVKQIAIYDSKYNLKIFVDYPAKAVNGKITKTYRGIL